MTWKSNEERLEWFRNYNREYRKIGAEERIAVKKKRELDEIKRKKEEYDRNNETFFVGGFDDGDFVTANEGDLI